MRKSKRPENMTKRSYNMSMIKGKDTKVEVVLRKELWHRGLRYRKNCPSVYGKPDIVFLRKMIAVFVDGDFWHGYEFEKIKERVKSNNRYWIEKIEHNRERDMDVTLLLIEQGWTFLRFWDFEIKNNLAECADRIENTVRAKSKN